MAYTVAQAEVTVLPDAKNFGRDLRAQISPEAEKIGRDIGDKLVAGLRERLREAHPDVNVGADTSGASAKVDEFLAETKAKATVAGGEAGRRMGNSMADEAGKSFGARGALIAGVVGAALIAGGPLLVGAAGVLFGGLAAVIVHNNDDVATAASKLGRDVSAAYTEVGQKAVPFLTNALNQVRVAAVTMAAPVGRIFEDLGPAVDGVTQGVIKLAQNALPGLSAAISTGRPVFAGLESLLASIGTGLGNFFSIISEHAGAMGATLVGLGDALDGVLQVLGELAGVGADVGQIILPPLAAALSAVADALGFLSPILPGLVIGFLALKTAAAIGPLLGSLAGSLDTVGIKALYAVDNLKLTPAAGAAAAAGFGAAATGARGLETAMGPIGWIIAGIAFALPLLSGGLTNAQKKQQEVEKSAEAMTRALEASKGAIDDNVRAQAAYEAQQLGLLDQAQTWGVAGSVVVDALLGNANAMDQVTAAAAAYEAAQAGVSQAQYQNVDGSYASALAAGTATEAADDNIAASELQRAALENLAVSIGADVTAQQVLAAAIDGGSDAAALNAERLTAVSNAANAANTQINLLKSALDALTGKAVSVGDAEVAVTNATLAAKDAMEGMTGKVMDANGQLDKHSDAGAKAWGILTDLAGANNTLIATMEQQGATSEEVLAKDAELRAGFVETAQAMGISSEEANRLADQIYGIPAERVTEIKADTQAATDAANAFKAKWDAIQSKTIYITAKIAAGSATAVDVANTFHNIDHLGGAIGGIVQPFAEGGFQQMQGGVAQVVKPNTWRVIGDRVTDDEAYIPINDSARSLSILAQTAGRMGFGLTQAGGGGRTDARSYTFQISAPSDPHAIAREVREAQRDLEFLHG